MEDLKDLALCLVTGGTDGWRKDEVHAAYETVKVS